MAAPPKAAASPSSDDRPDAAIALERRIVSQHAVRLHLALILATGFGAGLIVTKLLLVAGVHAMWIRYALAVAVAYGAFLLGIRLWLAFTGYGAPLTGAPGSAATGKGGSAGGGSWDLPSFRSGGGGGGGGGFRGGGGGSGGGGASASFAEGGSASSARTAGLFSASTSGGGSGSGGGSKSGGGFDLGDDGFVLIALVALIAAVCGAAIYLVYMAPTILSDAAFAALLSGGLVRSTRKIGTGGWVGSVVHDTWWPFAAVLALAVIFALVAQHYHPDAVTLRDVLRHL